MQHTVGSWKPPASLKRLQFLNEYRQHYAEVLGEVYTGTHKLLPKALQPSLAALESRVAAVGAPLLKAVERQSQGLLREVDRKVCSLCLGLLVQCKLAAVGAC